MSGAPGDHARFFDGDGVRLGDDVGSESLTATCMTRLPCRVSFDTTSYMLDLEFESRNLGILDFAVVHAGVFYKCSIYYFHVLC